MRRDLRLLSILPCSIFPDNPGRSLIPRRRQYDRKNHCRRAKGFHCADAIRCGPTAATSKWFCSCGASCLVAPSLDVIKGSVHFETPMAAAASSRTLLHSACDPPPPTSQTELPCGPRSSKLLSSPHPFLRSIPSNRAVF
jgi:hypothetical protein